MLELARGISQWAGFRQAIIFVFNTGEEDGLNGAHSFITQVGSIFNTSSNLDFFFQPFFSVAPVIWISLFHPLKLFDFLAHIDMRVLFSIAPTLFLST